MNFTDQLPESFTKLVAEVEWKTYLEIKSRVLKNGSVGNRQNELPIHLLIREGSSEIIQFYFASHQWDSDMPVVIMPSSL